MRRFGAVALAFALGGSLFAQHRGVISAGPHPGRAAVVQYGYGTILNPGGVLAGGQYGRGNILFPGGITSFPATAPVPLPEPRLGSLIPNYPPRYHDGFRGGRSRTIAIPYAVPVYVGGGWAYDYPPPQPAANVTVVIPQQPTPSVIINHNYSPETANPVMRDYSNSSLPEAPPRSPEVQIYTAPAPGRGEEPKPRAQAQPSRPVDDKPNIYLIALRDGTVRSAIGYWSEDGVLHYVTPQGTINRFSLEFLDTATTEQLNRERGLDWELKSR
ncbi:MAG TPA: hypothetical protein VFL57_00515 [Bryobacteraceae bacterium]|nr:hypothetical protein [Bryobacteraceae bacterium]